MTLEQFEEEFCKVEIPTKWNIYKWCREHKETAIAQALFRMRRIANRADFCQINISGGKDSTLSFEIMSLEIRYRKALLKAIENKEIIDYKFKEINYDESKNINDYDNFEKTEEAYMSFENINKNIPMIYLNSQDGELIFTDAIKHIQLDVNLVHGYGLYIWNGKIVCGQDIVPKEFRIEGIEIFADLWDKNQEKSKELNIEELNKFHINDTIYKAIEKEQLKPSRKMNLDNNEFVCVVHGDQTGHMFYKCLSISYQNGASYGDARFVAWDITKKDIWCREMPTREEMGLDVLTNYNVDKANYLPVSKIKPELVELHKDEIEEIDGVKCIANWGFGKRSLWEIDQSFDKMFGSLFIDKQSGRKLPGWSYISQSDEDAGGSETDTFARWMLANIPDEMKNVDGEGRHPTQIYSLVSIRSSESFDRFTILRQSEYFTGQYAAKEIK